MYIIRERGEQERDLAGAWWRLEPYTLLTLEDGRRCLLVYSGQPGGAAGPDVRDAVLRLLPGGPETGPDTDEIGAKEGCAGKERRGECARKETEASSVSTLGVDGRRAAAFEASSNELVQEKPVDGEIVGDVEFHLRAGDWFTHGHQDDPRYNRVILHVVYYLDGRMPARRQDGVPVPACSLLDFLQPPQQSHAWSCQCKPLAAHELTTTLLCAGLLRLAEKSAALERILREIQPAPTSTFDLYDTCLLPALAEGLGYGRDREFFRAAGLRLVGLPARVPEPLGRAQMPAPLDHRRLRALHTLCARWRETGGWQTLSQVVRAEQGVKAAASALRAALYPLGRARADILIVNIVLPFACAVAALEHDLLLATRAQQLYLAYPGLVSNRITRMMSTQLQLAKEPGQACLQQGLHYVYSQTCQAKRCQDCLCGDRRL